MPWLDHWGHPDDTKKEEEEEDFPFQSQVPDGWGPSIDRLVREEREYDREHGPGSFRKKLERDKDRRS